MALAGLALGCAAPPPTDTRAVAAALDSGYATFSEAYRTADPKLVANLYADSAYYLAPGDTIVRGRETIETIFAGFLVPFAQSDTGGPRVTFDIVDRRVSAAGDLATDVGYYTLNDRFRGKFIVIWRHDASGRWRIHADGYSGTPALRTLPPPPPSAPTPGPAPTSPPAGTP